MPHATEDEMMEDTEAGLRWAMQQEGGMAGMAGLGDNYVIDQGDKADDAVDFEDISDDDLPEEEEATHAVGGDDAIDSAFDAVPGGMGGLPEVSHMNGYSDVKESSDDGYDYGEDAKDLFGERTSSSPELERHPQPTNGFSQVPQRPGLALPSKSALALPSFAAPSLPLTRMALPRMSQSSLSPPPLHDQRLSAMSPTSIEEDGEDEENMDPEELMQKRLFNLAKRKLDGETVDTDTIDLDQDSFHKLYPSYDKHQAPRFIDLFPPRNVQYKGKAPLKPPKPVNPTKLSLDLLQDQERSFRSMAAGNKAGQDSTFNNSIVHLGQATSAKDDSDDDLASSDFDVNERIGNVTMQDLALICQDWDLPSIDSASVGDNLVLDGRSSDGDWDAEEGLRPAKKRRTGGFNTAMAAPWEEHYLSFEEPERAAAKLAKSVALDLNDPNLLIDEHAPRIKKRIKRMPGDRRDAALSRDIAKRYNISNDLAYDLLKENHQHKVRSTLGSMAVEHSNPAIKLQYPFYKVSLDKEKRAFHRPSLELRQKDIFKELKFSKPKHIKRKAIKGREAKEVFAKAEDLSLGDNASMLLLEYSEEAPMMLSNFGMGNRLINYYRKRDADDQERPKEPIGETQVLLTQDKSPFANFGHVDKGETVPTVQNGLFRAPVFQHQGKTSDFIIGVSSTHETYDRLYLRNVENLHVVGQQFPLAEVPGQHSRKVTDAAKKRLKALAYRIFEKSIHRKDKVLDNATLMPHLPGHDMPQTRSKMREFMKYERTSNRGEGSNGVWVPMPGQQVPDAETLRGWIRPEDVCLLDSMQVGVQHLSDLGISETKDADDEKDAEETTGLEQQLAPWRATKNFLNATQGKAMLMIHGEGDPSGRGLAFSFVKTSMKGGFKAAGESINDKLDAHKRSQNGGHSYNVAKQQKAYDDSIRRIWDAQKSNLSEQREHSDDEMDGELDTEADFPSARAETPRSYAGTPGGPSRHDDDMSQFSGHSAARGDKTLVIRRSGGRDAAGNDRPDEEHVITNPKVIKQYMKQRMEKEFAANANLKSYVPTGDAEKDRFAKEKIEKELARIKRNADRREARERLKKGKTADGASPSAAASPGPSDADGPASAINGNVDGTPQKGKGRTKDGTARKCANCGQVGHIKTNRKLCPLLNGTMKPEDAGMNGDSSFGAVAAPLTL
ncbi:Putative transcription initiation factor TFIID subunit [Fulvia fulva]|uniref:Transcription initiation factor TFIID subunit n=1 Tax=Passalora fulva TaxID=5499 RepID=A0A9Q8L7P7_PASFU|nr:Putative transcription initiation factor TFIID subunit [Fulvia fulva]KAK4635711.1 putative transcription initiation factor TFIID subunit [Fulvia fulva]KAK4636447.1 putative transcription initiation factor TFIID subunit [Fulvia fulva]UJO12397.1 Putative transcription initiation factor TFIID subunit [Fulvia fulva]WPV09116.1 Putative transcription initiation factor TFIID subunit [Fulvia fulva]WPV23087.1 Putative transcription initiation factor TFIID subunit [Fulvia fulva]